MTSTNHLRILIANEHQDRLEKVSGVVLSLGHEVVAMSVDVGETKQMVGALRPDVGLVGLGNDTSHALSLIASIDQITPVVLLLKVASPAFVKEAARRSVFSYVINDDAQCLQSAIDITILRFNDYHNLQEAFERRAVIEQAKGVLMSRHHIDQEDAFGMLRSHSQRSGQKLIHVAEAIVSSYALLIK